jgi:hypothetical protein
MIQGIRCTLDQTDTHVGTGNPLAYGLAYWTGSRSEILVYQETTGSGYFPPTGSLYAYTNRDQLVKIDYKGYDWPTHRFLDCTVDTNFFKWSSGSGDITSGEPLPSIYGGIIPYRQLMFYEPGVISISGSNSVDLYRVTIQNGGKLHIQDSASVRLGNYIQLNDGELKISGSIKFMWNNNWSGSVPTTLTNIGQTCFISQSNYHYTTLEIVGPEVRSNTVLTNSASRGDAYLTVQNTSSFSIGDWIWVGEDELSIPRTDNGYKSNIPFYRNVSSEDESFYVSGVDTNKLYVKRFNCIEAKVLETASATELIVDEERFNVGDKIVINNQIATISQVDDYELLLNDYDFTNPTASLADWDTENSRSEYFQGWGLVPGVGLTDYQQTSFNQFRMTELKTVFRDAVKIEAWMSNIPLTDTSSYSFNNVDSNLNSYFGCYIQGDPGGNDYASYNATSTSNVSTTRTYFGVWPIKGFYYISPRFEPGWSPSQSLELATGLQRPYNGLYKLGLEYSKGFYKAYINDKQVAEHMVRAGSYAGRTGIYSTNNRLIVTRFKTYAKCQKITLDAGVTASVGDWVSETGVEFIHPTSSQVIKLASYITDPLDHTNLAFGYKGSPDYDGTNIYPFIYQRNDTGSYKGGTGNIFQYLLVNDTFNSFDIGSGNINRNLTIDMVVPTSMSNAGFNEFYSRFGQNFTSSIKPLTISGSLDAINWTPLYGGIDKRHRTDGDSIRDFNFTPGVYRYVRFTFNGVTAAGTSTGGTNNNVIKSLYVRNFESGSSNPRIQVNNASDFNVGDNIAIIPANYANRNNASLADFYPYLIKGSGSTEFLDYFPDDHTITAVDGNVLTLDRIYNKTPLQKGAAVFKLTRALQFTGSMASGSIKTGNINSYATGFRYRVFTKIKNAEFQHQNNQAPYLNIANGIIGTPGNFYLDTPFTTFVFQGNSWYNNWSYGYWHFNNSSNASYQSGTLYRHNVLYNITDGWWYGPLQYGESFGVAPKIITGNIITNAYRPTSISNRASYVNYSHNFFGGCDNFIFSGPSYSSNVNINRFGYSGKYRINRNLATTNSNMFGNTNPNSTIYERVLSVQIKNNKLLFGNGTFGTLSFSPDYGVENFLWPSRGGLDARLTAFNPNGTLGLGGSVEAGLPVGYIINWNRFGYDVWTTIKGYIVKYPNDDWYRYYNFNTTYTTDIRMPFLSAGVQINTDLNPTMDPNITASFNLSFDYYHNIDQITQLDFPISMSTDTNLFPQDRDEWTRKGNNAAAMYLIATKDGNSILPGGVPYEILPKNANPTRYSKTLSLEGDGNYYIGIIQNAIRGYVAIRNMDSILIEPNDGSVQLTHNAFTVKNFTINKEKTIRKATIRDEVPNQKFRLKGAKLF